jgi:murein DD-endopeptidase MepM/ murein hydrolase activator NlpD
MIRLIACIAVIITLSGCVSSTPAPVIFHGASDGITKEIVKALKQHPKFEPRFHDILEQYKWIIPQDAPSKKSITKSSEKNIITQKFIKPVSGKIISSFGAKKDGTKNDGINIRAVRGISVKASASGKIIYANDELNAFGNLVLIRHANNIITAYAHLEKLTVKKNDEVKQGDVIGTIGSSGNVVTPQLHFEVRRGSKPVDPKSFVKF